MSLIERAVNRLGGVASPRNSGTAPVPGTAQPPEQRSTIEALMQRKSALESVSDDAAAPRVVPAKSTGDSRPEREPLRIDLDGFRIRGFVTPENQKSRISQEFRVIKRPLIANAFGKGVPAVRNGKRVMVVSSFPGEGKSFCAINLAMSIATERDYKVLLVDADVTGRAVSQALGIDTSVGLMDRLEDEHLDLASFVMPTNVDKLAVVPAGRRHHQATELLASASMSRLLDQISDRYPDRIVIFDSPPLLVTTESRVLATYMGQIVLVVEAGKTPREAMKESLAMLAESEVVGLVLNKARGSEGGGYGGYYGYGYGNA